jgi:hypothetical protein
LLTVKEAVHYYNSQIPYECKEIYENRICQYRITYPQYFKKERNVLKVKRELMDILLRRVNIRDIYDKLIDKYENDTNILKELQKRANISRNQAYRITRNICLVPINVRVSRSHEILYEMAEPDER